MRVTVDVKGNNSEWGIPSDLSADAIEAMRADGLNIIEPIYYVPGWIVQSGLIRPWCFLQDLWNFRNPL